MKLIFSALPVFLFSALAAPAQDAASGVAESAGPTLIELFHQGGWLMWVLLAFSVFAIANALYLLLTLREGRVSPNAVVRDVFEQLQRGDLQSARKVCDYRSSAFSHIAIAAIDAVSNLSETNPAMVPSVVEDAIEGEGARQAALLDESTEWLLDMSTIAPMVGLLGTVLGMLHAFHAVGDIAAARPVILAQGVSMALITTIAGLIIAVPCAIAYAYFRRRARKLSAVLECRGSEILQILLASRRGN